MKKLLPLLSFLLLIGSVAIACSGCGLPAIGTEHAVHGLKGLLRAKEPDPEAKWNKYGWWKRISENPPTYIPENYPATAPRTRQTGNWFIDQRDGKRLFVPVGNEVMAADAKVVTVTNAGDAPYEGQSPADTLVEIFGLQ